MGQSGDILDFSPLKYFACVKYSDILIWAAVIAHSTGYTACRVDGDPVLSVIGDGELTAEIGAYAATHAATTT